MYDMFSNHRFLRVRSTADETAGAAANSPASAIDLFSNGMANRAMLLIDVTDVNTTGTLDLIVQDSEDNSTFDEDFLTIPQITEAGLYLVEIDDPNRYLRLNHDVDTATVNWGAYLITFEEQRRPVTQSGTKLTPTYGTGRRAKVATS
jgi:hypothetical protein